MPYGDYLLVLRKRWWVIPLVVLAAALAAFLVARAQTPVFRSTSRLLVTPGRADFGQQQTVERMLRPMAQRVKTTDLAGQVDRTERLDLGAERLLGLIRAEAVIDQGFIQIDADDVDPERAERIAGAFAQLFAQQQAASDVGKPQAERVNVDVLDRPTPANQIAPQTRALVLAAGLVGLVGGIFLLFGLEYFDNTLKTTEDVERLLGLSTLAVIPRHPNSARSTPAPGPLPVGPRGGQRAT